MARLYSGDYVADYIIELTPDREDIVWSWLTQYVRPNVWEIKTIRISNLFNDPSFKESMQRSLQKLEDNPYFYYRYNPEEMDENDIFNFPIVFYNDGKEALLVDGYSRATEHLIRNIETIDAFVIANKTYK